MLGARAEWEQRMALPASGSQPDGALAPAADGVGPGRRGGGAAGGRGKAGRGGKKKGARRATVVRATPPRNPASAVQHPLSSHRRGACARVRVCVQEDEGDDDDGGGVALGRHVNAPAGSAPSLLSVLVGQYRELSQAPAAELLPRMTLDLEGESGLHEGGGGAEPAGAAATPAGGKRRGRAAPAQQQLLQQQAQRVTVGPASGALRATWCGVRCVSGTCVALYAVPEPLAGARRRPASRALHGGQPVAAAQLAAGQGRGQPAAAPAGDGLPAQGALRRGDSQVLETAHVCTRRRCFRGARASQDASSGLASAAGLRSRAVRALGAALEADERLLYLPEITKGVSAGRGCVLLAHRLLVLQGSLALSAAHAGGDGAGRRGRVGA